MPFQMRGIEELLNNNKIWIKTQRPQQEPFIHQYQTPKATFVNA